MKTRVHCKVLFEQILRLLLIVALGGIAAFAQTPMHSGPAKAGAAAVDIVRDPSDVPPPIGDRGPAVVRVTLNTEEVVGTLDSAAGTTYRYWTFNGKVPGPMIRVRQGDTVEVTLHNDAHSHMVHSVDFHAALGPGGGAAFSQVVPGQSKTFTFQAVTPGLFVYHCGTPMIAEHIANGMYGLILVEPPGGLPHVDHEYYLMQGEIYTTAPKGKAGLQQFSDAKLMDENPEYFVFNGAVGALTEKYPFHTKVGDTVRLFFGDAGPNEASSLHPVGGIFTRDYELGSLASPPLTGVQTASVPPGGAAMLELTTSVPGQFAFMDHAMARMAKGLMATMQVTGEQNANLIHDGPVVSDAGSHVSWVSGMSQADTVAASEQSEATSADAPTHFSNAATDMQMGASMHMTSMHMMKTATKADNANGANIRASSAKTSAPEPIQLNGCLTVLSDGRAMLNVLPSAKTYRLEGRPLLFSENANRLVHVTGQLGSVVAVEDPRTPSFVVETVDQLAPTCSAKITPAMLRQAAHKQRAGEPGAVNESGTVKMSEMTFLPATITINAGQTVTWKNSSGVIHNVVDDPSKALSLIDVKFPSAAKPFSSDFLQPGQTFSRTFTAPGIYRYVCTLHEANGMKGVIIVRPSPVMQARK